jgi:hypothetical protein
VKQLYIDLLKSEYASKSTPELQAMLAKPNNSDNVRVAIEDLLEERGAALSSSRLGIFLALWPWLPLLFFLAPNYIGWVLVYFGMIMLPLGAVSAMLGTVFSLLCLGGMRYYRLAISSGAISTIFWYWLHTAAISGGLGHIKT